jgi:hypothetical protein
MVANSAFNSAASNAVMRAGRHFAQFAANHNDTFFGVIRPRLDVEGGQDAPWEDGHCFYYTGDGSCYPDGHDWDGMQNAQAEGDRVGLLLDLDQGSMTVYKNDERLGVMATSLSGEYSWAVTLCNQGTSACIEAAPPPASPTAEELAQAVAYQAALISEADIEEEYNDVMAREELDEAAYIDI